MTKKTEKVKQISENKKYLSVKYIKNSSYLIRIFTRFYECPGCNQNEVP